MLLASLVLLLSLLLLLLLDLSVVGRGITGRGGG
jgi:hypothetical protein